eukprot:1109777-Prorocentrum_minimum.AAC.1
MSTAQEAVVSLNVMGVRAQLLADMGQGGGLRSQTLVWTPAWHVTLLDHPPRLTTRQHSRTVAQSHGSRHTLYGDAASYGGDAVQTLRKPGAWLCGCGARDTAARSAQRGRGAGGGRHGRRAAKCRRRVGGVPGGVRAHLRGQLLGPLRARPRAAALLPQRLLAGRLRGANNK